MTQKNCKSSGSPDQYTAVDVLRWRALQFPERTAYSFLGKRLEVKNTLTYSDLLSVVERLSAALTCWSVRGRPVVLIVADAEKFVLCFWACLLSGAMVVPLSKGRGQEQQLLTRVIKKCDPALVVYEGVCHADLLVLAESVSIEKLLSFEPDDSTRTPELIIQSDDTAFIQFTSGSSGDPKGVIVSHANLMDNLRTISRVFKCTDQDVGLSWLPLYHDMGLVGHVLQPVFAGIHNYFMPASLFVVKPLSWLQAISRYKVTISGGPNFSFRHCLQKIPVTELARAELNLQPWRVAYCGAECISPDVLDAFSSFTADAAFSSRAWLPCYGMAESTLLVTGRFGLQRSVRDSSLVSVGPAHAGICIVDAESGKTCVEGVTGEIWIRSPSLSTGYYATENGAGSATLSSGSALIPTESEVGYFRTGDCGLVEQGELFITGRLKNLIKVRGKPVHCEALESRIEQHFANQGIARCAVIGIVEHDTEAMVVFLETTARRFHTSLLQTREAVAALSCQLSGVLPVAVHILTQGQLPLTTSGKVRRRACHELHRQDSVALAACN